MERDEKLRAIKNDIISGSQEHTGYSVINHRLMFHGKTVLARCSTLIPMLLPEFHDSEVGGHSGAFKTYQRVIREFYWQGMKRQIQQYVAACAVCQQQKYLAMSNHYLFRNRFGKM